MKKFILIIMLLLSLTASAYTKEDTLLVEEIMGIWYEPEAVNAVYETKFKNYIDSICTDKYVAGIGISDKYSLYYDNWDNARMLAFTMVEPEYAKSSNIVFEEKKIINAKKIYLVIFRKK